MCYNKHYDTLQHIDLADEGEGEGEGEGGGDLIELRFQFQVGSSQYHKPNNRDGQVNQANNFKHTPLGHFSYPGGICLQPHTNHVLVCDCNHHRLQILNDQGQPLFAIGEQGHLPKQFQCPNGVCCSSNGDIFIADKYNHRIQCFDAGGRFRSTFGRDTVDAFYDRWAEDSKDEFKRPQELRCPFDICCLTSHLCPSSAVGASSAQPLLLVADNDHQRISVWTSSSLSTTTTHLINFKVEGFPRGLCVDMNGYVNVCCGGPQEHSVRIYDPRHNFGLVQSLSSLHSRIGASPGAFDHPTGICVDNYNTLIVADCENNRIQFFS